VKLDVKVVYLRPEINGAQSYLDLI